MNNGRLFRILYLLLEHRELTASWLAKELEVSQRTIYRDIDALSLAGIPVYAKQGQGGGICLLEQFKMDRQLLNSDEQELMLSALQSLHSVGAADEKQMLSRLSTLFGRKPVDWLEVNLESWGGRQAEKELFETFRQAIWNRNLIEFDYDNSEGEHSRRCVEPERLRFQGGCWYLSAWCRERRDHRLFRLNRISACTVRKETFLPRKYPPESSGQEKPDTFEPELVELLLEFTPKAAYRVLDYFAPDEIEKKPDGGYLVHTAFPAGNWLLGFLLSFGGEVRVRKPEFLQMQLKQEAETICRIYNGESFRT